eukprot:365253-Chlamydomonas_euryale.AAC.33
MKPGLGMGLAGGLAAGLLGGLILDDRPDCAAFLPVLSTGHASIYWAMTHIFCRGMVFACLAVLHPLNCMQGKDTCHVAGLNNYLCGLQGLCSCSQVMQAAKACALSAVSGGG